MPSELHRRIPGNLNISFAFVEGEGLMMGVKDLAVSSGSACTSASLEPSYVLRALGVDAEMAHTRCGSVSAGSPPRPTSTTPSTMWSRRSTHLRAMSPLWEMHLDGVDISR